MAELDASDKWPALEDDFRLARWRAECLLALGYELVQAETLAVSEIDIHLVARLIEKGCPRETAVRIAA